MIICAICQEQTLEKQRHRSLRAELNGFSAFVFSIQPVAMNVF